MALGPSELIQIDATIITGILILLTLQSTSSSIEIDSFSLKLPDSCNFESNDNEINEERMKALENCMNDLQNYKFNIDSTKKEFPLNMPRLLTATIIIPFALSAIIEVINSSEFSYGKDNSKKHNRAANVNGLSICLNISGFVYIIFSLIYFATISV